MWKMGWKGAGCLDAEMMHLPSGVGLRQQELPWQCLPSGPEPLEHPEMGSQVQERDCRRQQQPCTLGGMMQAQCTVGACSLDTGELGRRLGEDCLGCEQAQTAGMAGLAQVDSPSA